MVESPDANGNSEFPAFQEEEVRASSSSSSSSLVLCPVCGEAIRPAAAGAVVVGDADINRHIDACLSKTEIGGGGGAVAPPAAKKKRKEKKGTLDIASFFTWKK